MVMDWCDLENFAVEEFFGSELNDDGKGFDDKHEADDWQNECLAGEHGDDAECCAESERACIAHVEFCRRNIEPEKGQICAGDDCAKCGEDQQALGVGEYAEAAEGEDEQTGGETVEAISEIYGVGGGDDDENENGDIPDSQINFLGAGDGHFD